VGAWFAVGLVFLAMAVAMISGDPGSSPVLRSGVARPADFGHFIFQRYWLAVEILSVLLLVGLVTVMQIGRRRAGKGGA